MYLYCNAVRQLKPIPLEEVVMVGIRKKIFVFSLWWLLNGNVTVVEECAGASLRDALQFGIEFFVFVYVCARHVVCDTCGVCEMLSCRMGKLCGVTPYMNFLKFLYLCWDGCCKAMYRKCNVVRQLNSIFPEEGSIGVTRKNFFVFSLGWLFNDDVTVVDGSAGASLRDALQFGIDVLFLSTCVRAMWGAILAVFVRCCRADCGSCVA
jgi:hypothetical protein